MATEATGLYDVVDTETGNAINTAPLPIAGAGLIHEGYDGSSRIVAVGCAWFAGCDRQATMTLEHPVLGYVATCTRCAARDFMGEDRSDDR